MARSGEQLATYRHKRDFARTPEPAGSRDAGRRHRRRGGSWCSGTGLAGCTTTCGFEIDGVLVSWAVPKGPTLDPSARRGAFHVEDHPLEYFDFEGVIPAGEYGGGDVIVWDAGTWEPHGKTDDPAAAVASGELHVELYRAEAARPVRAGPYRPGFGRQGKLAAAAQARRVRRRRLGCRGPSGVGAVRPHQRAGAGRPGPAVAFGPAGRPGRGAARSRPGTTAGRGHPAAAGQSPLGRLLAGVRPRAAGDQPGQGAVRGPRRARSR